MKSVPALLALLVGLCVFPAPAESILVLPFFNLSETANLDWIGESLAESAREALAGQGIIALDRDARQEAYRRLSIRPNSRLTKASVIRVAESLDADQVLFGGYELTGPRTLRITAQVIRVRGASRGPEFAEIGALDDLARLQNHLAWQTLKVILPDSAPSEERFLQSQPPLKIGAIESYVRGLLAKDPAQRLKLFAQAVRIEPRYSQANFELGKLHYEKKAYKLATEHLQKVAANDNGYRAAMFFLGLSYFHLANYESAEKAFQLVAESVPLNEVWNNLAAAQSRSNSPRALENFKKALEGDSNDPDYHFNVGYALFKRGDLEAAADEFRAVLDRKPDDSGAITMLGRCLRKQKAPGMRETAVRSEGLERVKEDYEESAYLQLKAVLERK